jgi:hypothetical protein
LGISYIQLVPSSSQIPGGCIHHHNGTNGRPT